MGERIQQVSKQSSRGGRPPAPKAINKSQMNSKSQCQCCDVIGNTWSAWSHKISYRTSKSTRPYQRRRASITGLRLKLRKNIETGRLIGVAVARLVRLWDYLGISSWIDSPDSTWRNSVPGTRMLQKYAVPSLVKKTPSFWLALVIILGRFHFE